MLNHELPARPVIIFFTLWWRGDSEFIFFAWVASCERFLAHMSRFVLSPHELVKFGDLIELDHHQENWDDSRVQQWDDELLIKWLEIDKTNQSTDDHQELTHEHRNHRGWNNLLLELLLLENAEELLWSKQEWIRHSPDFEWNKRCENPNPFESLIVCLLPFLEAKILNVLVPIVSSVAPWAFSVNLVFSQVSISHSLEHTESVLDVLFCISILIYKGSSWITRTQRAIASLWN